MDDYKVNPLGAKKNSEVSFIGAHLQKNNTDKIKARQYSVEKLDHNTTSGKLSKGAAKEEVISIFYDPITKKKKKKIKVTEEVEVKLTKEQIEEI